MRKMRACHDREEACECNDVIPDWGLGELDDDDGLDWAGHTSTLLLLL